MPVKLEIAQILASASLIILVAALVAWARKHGRGRLTHGATALTLNSESAAMLLITAVGVSGVAAILAAAVWF